MAALAACGLLFAGCGYRFVDTRAWVAGVDRVHVAMFDNRTTATGVEALFSGAVVAELMRARPEGVAARPQADAVLSGVIRAMRIDSLAHQAAHVALEQRVRYTLDVQLTDKKGRILWRADGLQASEAYAVVAGNPPATEKNREAATAVLAGRLAEEVYRRLSDGF